MHVEVENLPAAPAELPTVGPPPGRPHGTRTRYVGDACRCPPCTAANATYQRERKRAMRRPDSIWLSYVPAGPARAHLHQILADGTSTRRTAQRVNLSPRTVAAVAGAHHPRITRRTRDAILTLTPTIPGPDRPALPARPDTADVDHLYDTLTRILDDRRSPWRQQAACRGPHIPVAVFFPSRGEPTTAAHTICGRCPTSSECLAYAQAHHLDHGIWGGQPHKTRRALRRDPDAA